MKLQAVTIWQVGSAEGWTWLVRGLIWLVEELIWLVEGGGGGEKWDGLSGKALVGFGLKSGGDSQHHPSLTNVIPMIQ